MTVPLDERRDVLESLHTHLVEDLVQAWSATSVADLSSAEFREMMRLAVPELAGPYDAAAGEFAADWYAQSAPQLPFQPVVAEPPPPEKLVTAVDWALGATGDKALDRLAGTLQRLVWDGARRTTIHNTVAETGARWARTATVGACAWCVMLASRGSVYTYESVDFDAHDACRCMAVERRPGQADVRPASAQQLMEAYEAARVYSGSGGSRHVDVKATMAQLRKMRGTH